MMFSTRSWGVEGPDLGAGSQALRAEKVNWPPVERLLSKMPVASPVGVLQARGLAIPSTFLPRQEPMVQLRDTSATRGTQGTQEASLLRRGPH